MKYNHRYLQPHQNIFNQISSLAIQYTVDHPHMPLLKVGVGDVPLPICPTVANTMARASLQLADIDTFVGYGSENGHPLYLKAIQQYYSTKGITVQLPEIFASDGAISQLCDIMDIFDSDSIVAVPDPSYPVYRESNYLAGRSIVAMPLDQHCIPILPSQHIDILYICNPANPTGVCYDCDTLTRYVQYCLAHDVVMIYDSAYSCFVHSDNMVSSIYHIPHADKCCIEVCSLSKSAGFTGVRCGYTIVPLAIGSANSAWCNRLSQKTNGVSYISQIGGATALTPTALAYTEQCTRYYLDNVSILRTAFCTHMNVQCIGDDSPYIWIHCPPNMDSWQYFRYLLDNCGILTIPGIGMGDGGRYHIRVSGYCMRDTALSVAHRLSKASTHTY